MDPNSTPVRKKEHLELCSTDRVSFRKKTNGFDHYEFPHNAATEVDYSSIDISARFFGRKIGFPFMISSMTGGVSEAENINARLAEVASELNIPIGVGSQRQLLENYDNVASYRIIRSVAPDVPVLGNIGASQFARFASFEIVRRLIDVIEADAMIIHLNSLQELIQKNGQPDFSGLLKMIEKISSRIDVPIIAKEVGAGISRRAAEKLLNAGVSGIDVAGAGGTSWSAVEILRNKTGEDEYFWDWGLPVTYCLKGVNKLKKKYKFFLIASGGIESADEIAKSIALGADCTASARKILMALNEADSEGVIKLISSWFEDVKKIMYLTGCSKISDLKKIKLIKKEELY